MNKSFYLYFLNHNGGFNSYYLLQCSHYSGIPWERLEDCYESGQSDFLLAKNGNRTDAVRPRITWIPTVAFNNYYNTTFEKLALTDLKTAICDLLVKKPAFCNDQINAIMM